MAFSDRFIAKPGTRVDLSEYDPSYCQGCGDKEEAQKRLAQYQTRLAELQELLYAEGKRALLIVLQAMDTGGKDGTIRHVMGAINPQSCRVTSFKTPTPEELAHDFLWRVHKTVPRIGEIGVFNRSHYEDVLIVRVHKMVPKDIWVRRYEQINQFEASLAASGVHILKFYLHISKEEQLERLKQRLEDPKKQWKVRPEDFQERPFWGQYIKAYQNALSRCSTRQAPWFIVPANHKWYRNLVISRIVIETLEELKMKYPKPAYDLSKIVIK